VAAAIRVLMGCELLFTVQSPDQATVCHVGDACELVIAARVISGKGGGLGGSGTGSGCVPILGFAIDAEPERDTVPRTVAVVTFVSPLMMRFLPALTSTDCAEPSRVTFPTAFTD